MAAKNLALESMDEHAALLDIPSYSELVAALRDAAPLVYGDPHDPSSRAAKINALLARVPE